MKFITVFFCFAVFFFPANAQRLNIDSLVQSLEIETNDTVRIDAYIKITKYYNPKAPVISLPYAISLVKLAEKVNKDKYLIGAYNQLGITYYFLGNTKTAAELFSKTLKLNEKNNDSIGISKSLNNIGLVYLEAKDYPKALQYFEKSLEIKLKLKDVSSLQSTYMNIGLVQAGLADYNSAIKMYYLGLDAWKTINLDKNDEYAAIMCEIGILYQRINGLTNAEEILRECAIIFKKNDNSYKLANTLLNLGIIYRKKKQYDIAENYIKESIKNIQESGSNSILPECYLELSKIEEAKDHIRKSFEYYKKYKIYDDSLMIQSNFEDMNQKEEIYLIEKQEAETLALKNEIELGAERLKWNRIVTIGIIVLLIIVVAFSMYLVANLKRKKKANKILEEQQNIINKANEELQKQKLELENLTTLLKQLNSDKDRFMAILAHDLKSPFNTLIGFSELLLQKAHELDIEIIEKKLLIINQTCVRTYNLVDDLLLWINSQSGKLSFEPQTIVFSEVCKEIIASQANQADSKGILLNFDDTGAANFFADMNMFKVILRNLISNAIKFTEKDGRIDVKAGFSKSEILITVSDNGRGIDKEDQVKIWDVSHIFSTPGTANEKGTGFGLLLCKEFVEKHGGKIWLNSEPGVGSEFKFTLPLSTVEH